MKRLTAEGSSDDTFGVYGAGPDDDHDNCASGDPIIFALTSSDESLYVIGQYAPGPCGGWLIGIAPTLDDAPIPDWPMHFERGDADYSPRLVIEAPDDVEVRYELSCHD